MRRLITANNDCWLTQSDINEFRPRVFFKKLPVNYPKYWTNWTNEQKEEYERKNGKVTIFDVIRYISNFDYSKIEGGIFGSPK